MMKNHTLFKEHSSFMVSGGSREIVHQYHVYEWVPASYEGGARRKRFVGTWDEEWIRDLIFDTMIANGRCGHSKKRPRLRRPKAAGLAPARGDASRDGLQCQRANDMTMANRKAVSIA